ncbi:MAG TPA: hypothetical protein VK689_12140, partial [Armatimonadota bacterium]|nr:hypothetical protein [Armatimonadota bacterium]
MALDPAVEAFREWIAGEYRADASFEQIEVPEGVDDAGGDCSVRLHVGKKSYYEARVDLPAGQLQVGFATESRMVNEAVEQLVLDNGGDLSDLLGDELCDLGEEPLPMDHFFERPAFRYIVRLPVEGPQSLADASLRARAKTVIQACR